MEWITIVFLLTFFIGIFPCLLQVLLCKYVKSKWIRLFPLFLAAPMAVLSALDFFSVLSLPSLGLVVANEGIPVITDWTILFFIVVPVLCGIGLGWFIGGIGSK